MKRVLLGCGVLAGLLLAAPPLVAVELEQSNPHDQADQCLVCHEDADGVGQPLPVVATCRKCHPNTDIHPVQMPPEEVLVPPDWPLEGGMVVCSTCHAEPSCDDSRGRQIPYYRGSYKGNARGFCFLCHDRKKYQRVEPHHPEGEQTCVACHVSIPPEGAEPSSSFLRAAPMEVCSECHGQGVHVGARTHMGQQLDDEVCEQLPANLPLASERRVACWTCHDVHQHAATEKDQKPHRLAETLRELAASEWELPPTTRLPGELDIEHAPLLAIGQNQLCLACHITLVQPSAAGRIR